MRKLPNLNSIVYFDAVARHSRITQAAEELLVTPSSVSQQIKLIEERLGVKLFRKIKRRLVLTEEGERYYASIAKALSIIRDAENLVTRNRLTRLLRIRTSASFGVRWLGPRLSKFLKRETKWELHVDATSEITDFEKENIDLEIRYGPVPPKGLHSQLLISDRTLPLCSPDLLKNNSSGNVQSSLSTHQLIHTIKARVSWNWWLKENEIYDVDGSAGIKFDRSSMSLQAARDGLGIVLETATLAMDDLQSGKLVPFAPKFGIVTFPAYFLVCPSSHLNRRSVTAFSEWISEESEIHEREKESLLKSLNCEKTISYSEIED